MKTFLTLILSFMMFMPSDPVVVEGVSLSKTVKVNNTELVLNGAGVREKYWIDLYVAALYLKQKSKDYKAIVKADEESVLEIHIVSELITSERMVDALKEGFSHSAPTPSEKMKKQMKDFKASLIADPIVEGDVYKFVYVPNKGTAYSKNGKLVDTFEGIEFKKGLLGIWLGYIPAQEDLKKALLGNG